VSVFLFLNIGFYQPVELLGYVISKDGMEKVCEIIVKLARSVSARPLNTAKNKFFKHDLTSLMQLM
jgi:hypothetical protein